MRASHPGVCGAKLPLMHLVGVGRKGSKYAKNINEECLFHNDLFCCFNFFAIQRPPGIILHFDLLLIVESLIPFLQTTISTRRIWMSTHE